MKKVVILNGSPRKGGNCDLLCDKFAQGALSAGNSVEKIDVAQKKIGYCRACYFCNDGGVCAVKDDMPVILQKMIDCDVLVLASPVYFYSMAAQLKAVIDRTVARYTELRNKEMYYIMTAAEDTATVMDGTLACMRGFADCVEGSKEMGILFGKGLYGKGEVVGTAYEEQAFRMGCGV